MTGRPNRLTVFSTLFLAMFLAKASSSFGQTAAEVVVADGQSISHNYKSWSLFLVCNPEWLVSSDAAQGNMRDLYRAFGVFGRIIGSDHLAVWFRKAGTTQNPSAPEAYDATEAADYCAVYHLTANDSPYLVVTTAYPTKNGSSGNYLAVSLKGLDNTNRLKLLGTYSDRIRMSDFRASQFDSDRYWLGWTQVLEEGAAGLGQLVKAMKFTVDAKAVKIEFDGSRLSP
jgi:hypothetical protein